MAFNVDGAERTAGAEVLARSTADATLFIDDRDLQADVTSATILIP